VTSLDRARRHYRRQKRVALAAVDAVRLQVTVDRDVANLAETIAAYQMVAAAAAGQSIAEEANRPPVTQPYAFAGTTAIGMDLYTPLATLIADLTDLEAEMKADLAELEADLAAGLTSRLDRFVGSEVADSGRAAASVEIYAEPLWTNYVRVLNPPSCADCVILAGRIYRDNDGFRRHPHCDCQHFPVEDWDDAKAKGFEFSPDDAYAAGHVTGLTKAERRAIDDGASIITVVNSRRGNRTESVLGVTVRTTTSGTGRKAAWGAANPGILRLRPETIYAIARTREEALGLLRRYGYLT
jgi:hypothetical protein